MSTAKIEKVAAELNKLFGEGIIGPASEVLPAGKVSTGSVSLDWGLGGGLPRSRVIEFFGYPSSGKTLLSLRQVLNYQRTFPDLCVGWVDAENSWEPEWAEAVGIGPDQLYLGRPDTGNQAFDIMEQVVRSGEFSLVVLDSLGMVPAQQEIERSMEQLETGVKARMGNKAIRKMQSALNYSARQGTLTTIIIINHIYLDLSGFRPRKTTPGGKGKDYAYALAVELMARKELRHPKEEDPNEDQYGLKVGYFVKKNKVGVPGRSGEFELFIAPYQGYTPGDISRREYISFMLRAGLIEKSGSWYTLPDGERFQGVDAVAVWLEGQDRTTMEDIHERCVEAWSTEVPGVPVDAEGEEEGERGAGEPGGEGPEGQTAGG